VNSPSPEAIICHRGPRTSVPGVARRRVHDGSTDAAESRRATTANKHIVARSRSPGRVDFVADGEYATMDNASDADLKQVVEDPEDAPLVEAAADLPAKDDISPSTADSEGG
jgi:hypothetical protein